MNGRQIQALRLFDSATQMRLTEYGNALVSRQAKFLLDAGFICHAPDRWMAYRVTAAGHAALKANEDLPAIRTAQIP